ncbi:DUF2786 domain-containing protein [Kineosporia rhizophila]|uniref:DUF2786 domain-containing protein n=1 Tax=Kineosporia rhizophila TaxID=84633 RepID=UPI001E617517|nr:DUF2786 domain-containing protein [Kineosporia rhizophila]MCE0536716.1 DUF2786 domain-containing protein [Kineosporia rhizophila]
MGSKDRRKSSASGVRGLTGIAGAQLPPEKLAEILLQAAMTALAAGDKAAFELVSDALVQRPDVDGWRALVARDLAVRLPSAVQQAWSRGWEPADVVRYVGRKLGPGRAVLAGEAVSEQLAGYAAITVDPRWQAQVAEFEVERWWPSGQTVAQARIERDGWVTFAPELLELVALLLVLPGLERIGPPPGEYRPPASESRSDEGSNAGAGAPNAAPGPGQRSARPVDERVLSRIRALLAKAEATTSEAEAEAFTAGAQERMARHSIDMAMVQAGSEGGGRGPRGERPATRRIWIDPPYEQSKTVLLNAVASANRTRSVWTKNIGFCTVIGFDADLDAVEALFTSLLVQATSAMTRAGRIEQAGGRARSKTFRQSFLAAYAFRIGERLAEITEEQTQAARSEIGDDRLLPVLASRQQDVEDRFAELFPTVTRGRSIRVGDHMGWASGRGAADQATFGTATAVRQ